MYYQTGYRSFEEVYRTFHIPIGYFLLKFVRDEAAAEDITQDTFEKVIMHAHKYAPLPKASFSAWIYQIARNNAINHVRRMRRAPHFLLEEVMLEKCAQDNSADEDAIGREGAAFGVAPDTPEEYAARKERHDILDGEISNLNPEFAETVRLTHWKGMSSGEIAAALGIPHGTILTRRFRAYKELRERLREYVGLG